MIKAERIGAPGAFAGYVLAAIAAWVLLGWFATLITGDRLLDQAQRQLARVEAGQPLWQWQLRKPHDLIAGRAFGHATVARDDDSLRITSEDGTPFELGLPIAWSLDLRHWPILQLELQSSTAGALGLIWQDGKAPACLAIAAHTLTPGIRSLRIDLRSLDWKNAAEGSCGTLGNAQMLRLRVQLPSRASLRIASAALWTTEPMPPLQDVSVDLPKNGELDERDTMRAQHWAMPVFHLPEGASAEAMLSWRDQLRALWPAALIVPADAIPHAQPAVSEHPATNWIACALYLLVLAWLAWRPIEGLWRPWVEIVGCLLGPLWLVMGLHWGLRTTPLGLAAFGGGLAYALTIERHHLSRLWRWPATGRDWLWPLAMLPVTALLILLYGHALRPLLIGHVITYFAWAWLQQWLMLVVLLRRFEQALHRPGWAIVPVALVFALLHTPNGMLMQLCFVGELWWAWCYLRSRSVLTIALAHAACALLVESGLTGSALLRSLEVSARYFL